MTSFESTMLPVFAVVLLGFLSVRMNVIRAAGIRGLVLFVFNFAIPALLFRSLAVLELPDRIDWGFVIAYYAAGFVSYALGMVVGRVGFGRGLADQAMFGMSASYSNLVMVGLPIVLTALGPEATLPLMLIIAFQSVSFMPLTVILIQKGRVAGEPALEQLSSMAVELVRNPIITSIALGLVVNLVGVPLRGGLDATLELLGAAAIPASLFALGGSLAAYRIAGSLTAVGTLSVVKLVVQPLLVWAIAVPLMGLEGIAVSVAILLGAMPSAVNTYLFAARYEVAEDVSARTVLLTTAASAGTLTLTLWLLTV